MKIKHSVTAFSVAVVALMFMSATFAQQKQPEAKPPSSFGSTEPAERTIHRRAVEAVIWGMPLVNTDAMRRSSAMSAQSTMISATSRSRRSGDFK